jgi:uncharacterized membrane protein YhaH (DUF805 family)
MNYYTDAFKKYAVFTGRASRKQYWMFFLFNLIAYIILSIISRIIGTSFLSYIYVLALIIPNLAISVRRLHDTDRSGWWLLIDFIPLVGAIILLVFLVTDSQAGTNKYGPNPKGLTATATTQTPQ